MTAVIEGSTEVDETEGQTEQEKEDGRKNRERDFTKTSDSHQELADFINSNDKYAEAVAAGVTTPVTANQVKAILALRTDYADTPEKKAEREARKAEREAEAQKYAGLTKEEIAAEKAAKRAETQAAKLQKRVEEALAKAAALREGKDASGADLAAEIEASQNGSVAETEAEGDEPKRRIGRRK